MHVPGVMRHLPFGMVVGTSPIATSYRAPCSHQRYTGILADLYLTEMPASLPHHRALETVSVCAAAELTVAVRVVWLSFENLQQTG